jgi:ATP synthase protein I
MAGVDGPGKSDHDDELEKRRRDLEATLAARRPERGTGSGNGSTGSAAGFGQAMKLSSEFVAGILVGAVLGWVIDWFAGTSPWGLIIFLLLGFGAGILNVLRSVGLVAEPMQGHRGDKPGR